MMHGIDISSWQGDAGLRQPSKLDIDFCIVKATQGNNYVNPYCDLHMQDCFEHDIPCGFYHYADSAYNAKFEAEFFRKNTINYEGHAIPVLDFEIVGGSLCREYIETFCATYHDMNGIWPMVYISALSSVGNVSDLEGSWVPEKCGLWLAGYPAEYKIWTWEKCPYDISPWKVLAIWQFTSQLQLKGYPSGLDGNIAYMDKAAWKKYCGKGNGENVPVQPVLSYHKLVGQIVKGTWGNGADRKQRLINAGYDYDTVQNMVNDYYEKAREVIQGIWGNGWNRREALKGAGYDYDTMQYIVNQLMKG